MSLWSTVAPVITLVLTMQACPRVMDLRYLIHKKHVANAEQCTQLKGGYVAKCTQTQVSNIYQSPQTTTAYVRRHTRSLTQVVPQPSVQFRITCLPLSPESSQVTALPMDGSASKLRVFFEALSYLLQQYVFHYHLICGNLLLFFIKVLFF